MEIFYGNQGAVWIQERFEDITKVVDEVEPKNNFQSHGNEPFVKIPQMVAKLSPRNNRPIRLP